MVKSYDQSVEINHNDLIPAHPYKGKLMCY